VSDACLNLKPSAAPRQETLLLACRRAFLWRQKQVRALTGTREKARLVGRRRRKNEVNVKRQQKEKHETASISQRHFFNKKRL